MNKDFITIKEMMELVDHTHGALNNLRLNKEKFPFYKVGKKIFYKKSEILEIISLGRVSVADDITIQKDFDFIDTEKVMLLTGYGYKALANDRIKGPFLFPFYKVSRKIFYKLSEVVSILENNKTDLKESEV